MAKVTIPLLFQELTGGVRHAEVSGATVAEVVCSLEAIYPGIASRIHRDGKLDPHVLVTVDGKLAPRGLESPVGPQSEVGILPTFGGG